MSILSRIFAKPEDASKVIDGAVKGLDKIFFTQEEKAEANAKLSEWYLKYLAATESQNIARRFIAMVVVLLWAFLVLLGTTIRWFNESMSEFIFKILVDVVMTPFSIVIGFYFLTHAVRAYTSNKK
jgi:hypothetical protein